MKYALILIIIFLMTSCCGTKKVIDTQPEPSKKITVAKEASEKFEVPSIPEVPEPTDAINIEEPTIPLPPKAPELEENNVTDHYASEAFNHSRWNKLLQKNVTKTGTVNYKAFRNDRIELSVYIDDLTHNLPTEDWNKEDKLAYWINTYNALTIDLILMNYPTKSIKDIKDPWDQRLWQFGDKWLNLNDIEHEILRKMNEPRIHFAIVCASVSCPKLKNKAFTASNIEEQLTNATKAFLSDTSKNKLSKGNIKLSKIFKWFKKDFEVNGSLIDFLNQYSETTISNGAKKSYMDYDWNLNN